MILEFKSYELKKDSKYYKKLVEEPNKPNEFIIVGEEVIGDNDFYKAHQIDERGLVLIADFHLDEIAYCILKSDLQLQQDDLPGYLTHEFDIPKKHLSMDLIETIQRLNGDER